MAVTTFANMQIVPEKFSQYTLDRSTELNSLVRAGIATGDSVVGGLINGTPAGGRFIMLPQYEALEGEDDVFGEADVSVGNITTSAGHATLLMRQRAWGATDLSHVLGGSDPMGAITQLIGDWWNAREQAIYMSILNGILDPTNGCLKGHVNDITSAASTSISVNAALDTKQLLGDHYASLGMVFMHSAVYTQLQKNQNITTVYDSDLKINIDYYLNYRVIVDDRMPYISYETTTSSTSGALLVVSTTPGDGEISINTRGLPSGLTAGTSYVKKLADTAVEYTTYFLGSGAFIRQDGTPAGFVGTETDRDKIGAKDYLINRRCMVIHPRGLSWNTSATYPSGTYYPTNTMLGTPANWSLTTDAKKIPIAALVSTL